MKKSCHNLPRNNGLNIDKIKKNKYTLKMDIKYMWIL